MAFDVVRRLRLLLRVLVGRDLFYWRQRTVPLHCLGNPRADWSVCLDLLDASSIIYSFGVGTDISFDEALIAVTGAVVHAFDPTPRAIDWLGRQRVPPEFVFHGFGIAAFDGIARFAPPENPAHVSFSMLPDEREGEVAAPVFRLSTIARRLGHDRIDLLKMDIEGAEYEVLRDCLADSLPISQLLIEFHHRWPKVGLHQTRKAMELLCANGFELVHVSPSGTEYVFLHD